MTAAETEWKRVGRLVFDELGILEMPKIEDELPFMDAIETLYRWTMLESTATRSQRWTVAAELERWGYKPPPRELGEMTPAQLAFREALVEADAAARAMRMAQ